MKAIIDLNAAQLVASAISRAFSRWAGDSRDRDYYENCTSDQQKIAHIQQYSRCAFNDSLSTQQAGRVKVWLDNHAAAKGPDIDFWMERFEELY